MQYTKLIDNEPIKLIDDFTDVAETDDCVNLRYFTASLLKPSLARRALPIAA